MKEKKIYTHCKNRGCGKKLPFSTAGREYCDNNNRCKNAYNYSKRVTKVAFADHVIDLLALAEEYQRKFELILDHKPEHTIHVDYFELMGIDMTSTLFDYDSNSDPFDFNFIYFTFSRFNFCYSLLEDMVTIRKNDFTE